ncbi:MAG: PIG-L family deacetylase [Chloroflexi bacterium]|nr:PIG-L family deacetylase [Chloroflexota bacterium]
MSEKKILVIAAHPDDEVLGCGGTIAKLSSTANVQIAILGEGATSRVSAPSQADPQWVGDLQTDARNACKLMGAAKVSFEGLPDNRFDQLPLLEVVKKVESLLEELAPDTIYTHHPGDLNIDHQITFRAVLTATRPMVGCPVRDIYTFEIPSSSEWSFQRVGPAFQPNVFEDISTTMEKKIGAMECYQSEIRPFPHPRSPEALRAIGTRWGSVVGLEYSEAFELIRSVR